MSNGTITVSFNAPTYTGNSPIIDYTATTSPEGHTATGTSSPIEITATFTVGQAYTISVQARNAAGMGPSSPASNAVTPVPTMATVPAAPVSVTPMAGDGQVSVAFVLGSNGGSAVTKVTVTVGTQVVTGLTSPILVTGLTDGTQYTASVFATNAIGDGAATQSAPFTPQTTAPSQVTSVVATAGNTNAVLGWTPGATGGTATSWQVTSTPTTTTQTFTASSHNTFTGLTNGTAYVFSVIAMNTGGSSLAATSNSVTPMAPSGSLTVIPLFTPQAQVGRGFFAGLATIGGQPPYAYTDTSSLALKVNSAGSINGSPLTAGTLTLTGTVQDVNGLTGSYSIPVTCTTVSGTLAIGTTALNNFSIGGPGFQQVTVTGGKPPYMLSVGTVTVVSGSAFAQGPRIDADLMTLQAFATAAGQVSFPLTVTDITGATATQTLTWTADTTSRQYGLDYSQSSATLPSLMVGSKWKKAFFTTFGSPSWSGTGLPAGMSISSAGVMTGTPTTAGSGNANINDGNETRTYAWTVLATQSEARPAANTGSGWYVSASGRLYTPAGKAYQGRGTNQLHYDSNAQTSIARMGTGICRAWYDVSLSNTTVLNGLQAFINNGIVPMLTEAYYTGGGSTTNSSDVAQLGGIANYLVTTLAASTSLFNLINSSCLFNCANEWGPGSSAVWLNAYLPVSLTVTSVVGNTVTCSGTSNPFTSTHITFGYIYLVGIPGITNQCVSVSASGGTTGAWTFTIGTSLNSTGAGGTINGGYIGLLRARGFTMPAVVDAGGSGQDLTNLLTYGPTLVQADPINNTILSLHIYGFYSNIEPEITAITKANPAQITFSCPTAFMYDQGSGNGPYTGNVNFGGYNSALTMKAYGVQGMTQINGVASVGTNINNFNAGTTINSSGFSTYTGGGYLYASNDYRVVIQQLAALQAQGIMPIIGEFGPSNPPLSLGAGSNTWITSRQVMDMCEATGLTYCRWAADDGTGSNTDSNYYDYAQAGVNSAGQYDKGYYATPNNLSWGGLPDVLSPYYGYNRWGIMVPDFI